MGAAAVIGISRLVGRPVIWDLDETGDPTPTTPWVRERTRRLSRGLRATGLVAGQSVVILCCPRHAEDRAVAVGAVKAEDAVPVIPMDWSPAALRVIFAGQIAPSIHLACEHGVEAWRLADGRGMMIGDGIGVMWWKALECRHAVDPAPSAGNP